MTPRSVTPIPPVPMANPASNPEAITRFPGRRFCPMTIVKGKVEIEVENPHGEIP
jgi:hypothetical protein